MTRKETDPSLIVESRDLIEQMQADATMRTILSAIQKDPGNTLNGSGKINIAAVCRVTQLPKGRVQTALQRSRELF